MKGVYTTKSQTTTFPIIDIINPIKTKPSFYIIFGTDLIIVDPIANPDYLEESINRIDFGRFKNIYMIHSITDEFKCRSIFHEVVKNLKFLFRSKTCNILEYINVIVGPGSTNFSIEKYPSDKEKPLFEIEKYSMDKFIIKNGNDTLEFKFYLPYYESNICGLTMESTYNYKYYTGSGFYLDQLIVNRIKGLAPSLLHIEHILLGKPIDYTQVDETLRELDLYKYIGRFCIVGGFKKPEFDWFTRRQIKNTLKDFSVYDAEVVKID